MDRRKSSSPNIVNLVLGAHSFLSNLGVRLSIITSLCRLRQCVNNDGFGPIILLISTIVCSKHSSTTLFGLRPCAVWPFALASSKVAAFLSAFMKPFKIELCLIPTAEATSKSAALGKAATRASVFPILSSKIFFTQFQLCRSKEHWC